MVVDIQRNDFETPVRLRPPPPYLYSSPPQALYKSDGGVTGIDQNLIQSIETDSLAERLKTINANDNEAFVGLALAA